METVYQVQFRKKTEVKIDDWETFNANGNKYDLLKTIEDARALLEKARNYHNKFAEKYKIYSYCYEYRILKIQYTVETIEV